MYLLIQMLITFNVERADMRPIMADAFSRNAF